MAFNDTKDLARHSKANHQMQGSEAVFRRNVSGRGRLARTRLRLGTANRLRMMKANSEP